MLTDLHNAMHGILQSWENDVGLLELACLGANAKPIYGTMHVDFENKSNFVMLYTNFFP